MTPAAGANTSLAALLLTNRLATVAAKPFTASEFWRLVDDCERLDDLLAADVPTIMTRGRVEEPEAARIRTLLDASRAFAFERERLADGGIALVSAIDPTFPSVLRERLGASCPPFLLVAGPIEWLSAGGLAIVGSGDVSTEALDVARAAAQAASDHGWPLVTGLATGLDELAIDAAGAGGRVVAVPAAGINVVSKRSEVRRLVHDGRLCIASPYAPDSRPSAAASAGRQKIVAALSTVTFVATADKRSKDDWACVVETLEQGWSPVGVWTGPGAGPAHAELVARGAHPIRHIDELFDPMDIAPAGNEPSTLF